MTDPQQSPPVSRSPGKFANRSKARTVAFQILYQEDLNPGSAEQFAEEYLRANLPNNEPLLTFARTLVNQTRNQLEQINASIEKQSLHWTVSRMNATDRNILRLAIAELLIGETPMPVVINEAIELAKQFGTKDSPAFVNGILDAIQATGPGKPEV